MSIVRKFEFIFCKENLKLLRGIKVLRTDNGEGYNSHEFANFYKTYEIKRLLTVTYIP